LPPNDGWGTPVHSERPRRCAVVLQTPRDPHSAVYMSYRALGAALEARGHSLEILCPTDFASIRRWHGRWVPLAYPFAVASWLRQHRADVDVVMFHSYAGWLATARWRGSRPRTVVMFHGIEPLYHRELVHEAREDGRPLSWRYRLLQERLMPWMLRRACGAADAVTCLNKAEATFLVDRNWASPAQVRVVAHSVPEEFFAPLRADRPLRSMLFVGQWLPMKGIRYLRDAAVTLLQGDPSMRLVCAGTLTAEPAVLADFPTELHRRVVVRPRVEPAALAGLYREADVFVFPSLYEAFSRAVAEAMASRLPIVTTAVGVAADALRNEESALIVPRRSAGAIVDGVRRLKEDAGFAARLADAAAAAAERYRHEFTEPATLAAILGADGGTL
jgi:glycosyltransferase involved in cell wall biosynthesis